MCYRRGASLGQAQGLPRQIPLDIIFLLASRRLLQFFGNHHR
jgi:hypothetical protein